MQATKVMKLANGGWTVADQGLGRRADPSSPFAHETGRAFRPESLGSVMNAYFAAAVAGLAAGGAYALLGSVPSSPTDSWPWSISSARRLARRVRSPSRCWPRRGCRCGLSALAGVIVGAAAGVAVGAIMTRWFAESPASTKAAVAVALLVGLAAVGLRITGGQHPHDFPSLISGSAFRLAGVEVTTASVATLGAGAGVHAGRKSVSQPLACRSASYARCQSARSRRN